MSRLVYWLIYADQNFNYVNMPFEWLDSSAPLIADGIRLMSFVRFKNVLNF